MNALSLSGDHGKQRPQLRPGLLTAHRLTGSGSELSQPRGIIGARRPRPRKLLEVQAPEVAREFVGAPLNIQK
jgi:hypothetical protein